MEKTNEVKATAKAVEMSEEVKTAIAEAVKAAQYPMWKKAVWFVAGTVLGGVGTYVGMKNM